MIRYTQIRQIIPVPISIIVDLSPSKQNAMDEHMKGIKFMIDYLIVRGVMVLPRVNGIIAIAVAAILVLTQNFFSGS